MCMCVFCGWLKVTGGIIFSRRCGRLSCHRTPLLANVLARFLYCSGGKSTFGTNFKQKQNSLKSWKKENSVDQEDHVTSV